MRSATATIRPVVSEVRDSRSVATVRQLFEEYARSIGVDLAFQGFEEELRSLPGAYAPPHGCLKLVCVEGTPAGCVGLRPRSRTTGEVKRLYVRERFRGRGLGRHLSDCVMADARRIGYRRIVLDTLSTMAPAIALYRSLGFVEIEPYYENPLPGARFFAKAIRRSIAPPGHRSGARQR